MNNECKTTQKSAAVGSSKTSKKRQKAIKKPANEELLELTRQAEKMGYGISYGKYVSKTGL